MIDENVIAIDLGGTKITGAIFDANGKIYHKKHCYIDNKKGEQVADLITNILDQLRSKSTEQGMIIQGVGIAVPGIYRPGQGTVWAPNIPNWQEYPLYDQIKKHLEDDEIPVTIDSDRACYIAGEVWKGAAVGCKHAIYLAVGTGIGAGILVNGQILRGSNDISGAIGWMALSDSYLSDYESCGCFEFHASGNGIARAANKRYSTANKQHAKLTTQQVFQAYNQQDQVAIEVLDQAIKYWGMATANLVSLFNPEKIVFGGGVFGPGIRFLDDIYHEATRWAQPVSIQQVQFVSSQIGSNAGLYGAGYLALNSRQHEK